VGLGLIETNRTISRGKIERDLSTSPNFHKEAIHFSRERMSLNHKKSWLV
jgi:hypothetical protein